MKCYIKADVGLFQDCLLVYDSSLNIVSARKLAVDLGLKNKEILSNFKDNLHTALEVTHPVEVDSYCWRHRILMDVHCNF